MKVTIIPAEPKSTSFFKCGDYFQNGDSVRQIIKIQGNYAIIDPQTGQWVTAIIENTPDKLMQMYIKTNGTVKKLQLKELILNDINESLAKGDF